MEEDITPEPVKKEITEGLKMETILLVLSKKKKLQDAAAELGVSRETVRLWKKRAMQGMQKALKTMEQGRRPKNYVKEDDLRANLENIRERLEGLEKEKKALEEEKKSAVNDLWMARRVISFVDKNFAVGAKKNKSGRNVLKNVFSNVPKKRYNLKEE